MRSLCTSEHGPSLAALPADPARALSARPRPAIDYTSLNSMADAISRCRRNGLLDLRRCGLSDIPALVHALPDVSIKVLDLRYNELSTLTGEVMQLPSLVILSASHNELEIIADEVRPEQNCLCCVCC
jgi:hypothetical protein